MQKRSKMTRNDEFRPKSGFRPVLAFFSVHLLNPFDTLAYEKITCKSSSLRVVTLMSTRGNGFTNWQTRYRTILGAQGLGLPMTPSKSCWLPPGGQWKAFEKKRAVKFQSFSTFWQLSGATVSKVKEMRSAEDVHSGHPGVPSYHANTHWHLTDTTRDSHSKVKIVKIWCGNEGALPPATPVNPYLGGERAQKMVNFFKASPLMYHIVTSSLAWIWSLGSPRTQIWARGAMGALHCLWYWRG